MHIFHFKKKIVNDSLAYTHKFTVVVGDFFFSFGVRYNFFKKITYIKVLFNEVLNAL